MQWDAVVRDLFQGQVDRLENRVAPSKKLAKHESPLFHGAEIDYE